MNEEFDLERTINELQAGISPEENFRRLFLRYRPVLDRFFARIGNPKEDLGDLTQETFLGIYNGIGKFRRESRFEGWIFAIATNVHRHRLRGRSAAKRAGQELSMEAVDPTNGNTMEDRLVDGSTAARNPEHLLLETEQAQRLLRAVDGLPPQMRKCLILSVFQNLSYREIGVVLRLSPETVRSHLYQARRLLRKHSIDSGSDAGSQEKYSHG